MKILHINGTAYGGAANYARDLHESLLNQNIDSVLYLPKKRNIPKLIYPNSFFFKIHSMYKIFLNKIINKVILRSNQTVTTALFNSYEIKKIIKKENPDVINLHWVGNEFLSMNEIIRISKPIVWTLHDMWVFLPVEHYSDQKSKKITKFFDDFFLRKKRTLNKKKINFIPTSSWMEKQLLNSHLYDSKKIRKIPCGIKFNDWYPEKKETAKNILGLDKTKKIILFSSMGGNNPRKGFNFLLEALNYIDEDYQLVIAGDQFPKNIKNESIKFFDKPSDLVTRRLLYSAADVVAAPSILEAFGLVALEAAACGTPSVVFKDTGLTEVIKHKENGYVANNFDKKDYANGIIWVLNELKNDPLKFLKYQDSLKKRFDIEKVAKEYLNLYENIQN
ncbi:glycosyltransferase [Pelagibacterales bacterium SAG-MED39]|nr:glycosyltransferase [Pelagibacterales bacterium SAG-MED39]